MEQKATLKGYILVDADNQNEYIEKITRTNSGLSLMICHQPEDAMLFQYPHEALTWGAIVNLSNKEQGYPSATFKAMKLLTILEDIEEGKDND